MIFHVLGHWFSSLLWSSGQTSGSCIVSLHFIKLEGCRLLDLIKIFLNIRIRMT
jgi:hypothetical protein